MWFTNERYLAGTASSNAKSVGSMNGRNTGKRTPRSRSPESAAAAKAEGQRTPRYDVTHNAQAAKDAASKQDLHIRLVFIVLPCSFTSLGRKVANVLQYLSFGRWFVFQVKKPNGKHQGQFHPTERVHQQGRAEMREAPGGLPLSSAPSSSGQPGDASTSTSLTMTC